MAGEQLTLKTGEASIILKKTARSQSTAPMSERKPPASSIKKERRSGRTERQGGRKGSRHHRALLGAKNPKDATRVLILPHLQPNNLYIFAQLSKHGSKGMGRRCLPAVPSVPSRRQPSRFRFRVRKIGGFWVGWQSFGYLSRTALSARLPGILEPS